MKCNIVLSGSGIRFPYFIGALEALEYLGYDITAIAGTSGGAIVATGYAFTKDIPKLTYLLKQDITKLIKLNWKFWKTWSILTIDEIKFNNFVYEITKAFNIQDSKIPLKIGVTNISLGKHETIKQGTIFPYLRASMSVPVIFPPVKINNYLYADGAICKNILAECWVNDRPLDELTIVIYITNNESYTKRIANFKEYITSVIQTSISCNSDEELEDVYRQKGNNVLFIPIHASLDSLDFKSYTTMYSYMIKHGFTTTLRTVSDLIENKKLSEDK